MHKTQAKIEELLAKVVDRNGWPDDWATRPDYIPLIAEVIAEQLYGCPECGYIKVECPKCRISRFIGGPCKWCHIYGNDRESWAD